MERLYTLVDRALRLQFRHERFHEYSMNTDPLVP